MLRPLLHHGGHLVCSFQAVVALWFEFTSSSFTDGSQGAVRTGSEPLWAWAIRHIMIRRSVCWSVYWSVHWSVYWSVRWSADRSCWTVRRPERTTAKCSSGRTTNYTTNYTTHDELLKSKKFVIINYNYHKLSLVHCEVHTVLQILH